MPKYTFQAIKFLILSCLILAGAGCQPEATPVQPAEKAPIDAPAAETPPVEVSPVATSTPLVGGDRDAHGCIGSAGYSWCASSQKCLRIWEEDCLATSTVLVSTADSTKFCDGKAMDSQGYRKTVTREKQVSLPTAGAATPRIVKAVIEQAAEGMCRTSLKDLAFRVENGTVYIPAVEAWAGVSIVMCYCKPLVEVNLMRLPGVEKVVWE